MINSASLRSKIQEGILTKMLQNENGSSAQQSDGHLTSQVRNNLSLRCSTWVHDLLFHKKTAVIKRQLNCIGFSSPPSLVKWFDGTAYSAGIDFSLKRWESKGRITIDAKCIPCVLTHSC